MFYALKITDYCSQSISPGTSGEMAKCSTPNFYVIFTKLYNIVQSNFLILINNKYYVLLEVFVAIADTQFIYFINALSLRGPSVPSARSSD